MSVHVQDPPGPQTVPGRRPVLEIGWNHEDLKWDPASPAGRCLQAIRMGAHFGEAAMFADISVDSLRRWLVRGRTLMIEEVGPECSDADLQQLKPNYAMYVQFYRMASRNEAAVSVEMVGVWRQAAQEDWRAARDFLARRFPHQWQPRDRLELSRSEGTEADAVAVDVLLNDPEARELLARLEERVALGTGAGGEMDHDDHDPDEEIVDGEIIE